MAGVQPWVGLGGHSPSQSEWQKKGFITDILNIPTILQVKKPDVVMGGLQFEAGWTQLMVEKLTLNYLAIAGGHSCSQHANCTLPQLETFMGFCCDKTSHFKWPFVPCTSCTWVMIMLFIQFINIPHLSGEWIVLAKEKRSLTWMLTNLCTILEMEFPPQLI
jgi:hypothetical protein